nr:TrkA family potassium uptake protein [candidate division Zixibacteria bacterium]
MRDEKFAIIGLGNFGATVARELADLKCKVTAIDSDKNKIQDLDQKAELAIVADATERKFLENLGVENYTCFVISTGKDSHASILITLHLKELGARKIIVKANSSDHARILMKVGANDALIPEEQMAIRISHSLAKPNLLDFLPLSGDYYVAELKPGKKFIDRMLKDIAIRSEYHVQVIAVRNSISGQTGFAPGGDYKITKNDILIVLGKGEDIEKIKE